MTVVEKLQQKQISLEEHGKKLQENDERIQRLGNELKTLRKILTSGEPIDTDSAEKQMDFLAEEFKALDKRIKDLDILRETPFEISPDDTRFALEGYPIPTPFLKFVFVTDLHVSGMFTVCADEKAEGLFRSLTGGAFDEEITSQGPDSFVEAMFSDNFDDDIAYILMNAFFWILYFMGGTWLPVRSYAIEMLKLFPKAILEQYPTAEDFIGTFSHFTRKTLASRGICSLKARPTADEGKKGMYSIKATGAFQHLLEPTKKAMKETS